MIIRPLLFDEAARAGLDEPMLDVSSRRLSVLSRGRNAWHGSWVNNYQPAPGATELFGTPASAQRQAERRRVQGSQFHVTEAPGLVVRSRSLTVVFCDFHPDNPFHGWDPARSTNGLNVLLPGTPMREVLNSFGHRSPNWARAQHKASMRTGSLLDVFNLMPLGGRKLGAWTSRSFGGSYELGWDAERSRFTRSGTNSIVREFQRLVDRTPEYRELLAEWNRDQLGMPRATDSKQVDSNRLALSGATLRLEAAATRQLS